MNKVKSFKDLIVWQVASNLAKDIATQLVSNYPKEEKYRLSDQIVRSSRSVAAQIPEGFGKSSLREKNRFYEIAATSNDETENHLTDARNINYIDDKTYKHYLNRIIRIRILLSHLRKSIRSLDSARKTKPVHNDEPDPLRSNQFRVKEI